jgi:hypothetical protein
MSTAYITLKQFDMIFVAFMHEHMLMLIGKSGLQAIKASDPKFY